MRVRLSNEMALVLLVVALAILFSAIDLIRENPWLVPAGVGGTVLFRRRRTMLR
jgi:hypothetical protein